MEDCVVIIPCAARAGGRGRGRAGVVHFCKTTVHILSSNTGGDEHVIQASIQTSFCILYVTATLRKNNIELSKVWRESDTGKNPIMMHNVYRSSAPSYWGWRWLKRMREKHAEMENGVYGLFLNNLNILTYPSIQSCTKFRQAMGASLHQSSISTSPWVVSSNTLPEVGGSVM